MCKLTGATVAGVGPAEAVAASFAEEKLAAAAPAVADDPSATDLSHFRPDAGSFEALPPGEFAFVSKIATGIHGDVLRYRWAWRGAVDAGSVAVKKLRRRSLEQLRGTEASERRVHFRLGGLPAPCQEDALTEIGVLQRLASQPDLPLYLLRMLGVFSDSSSDSVWLVTEHAEGGELFSQVSERGPLPEEEVRCYSWQLLQAVSYLHRHNVGHRDISLENVLLKGGDVRLMDFGMAVQSRSASTGEALRYFRTVGKEFYCAPECYVPQESSVMVAAPDVLPASGVALLTVRDRYLCEVRLPSAASPGRLCCAEVLGYEVPPVDMFAVGVCVFIMAYATPPWGRACIGDSRFAYVRSRGLTNLITEWNLPSPSQPFAELLDAMTSPNPAARRSADAWLESPWFDADSLSIAAVPCHAKDSLSEPMALRGLAGA